MDLPDELVGNWMLDPTGRMVGDQAQQRILDAVRHFVRIDSRDGGWAVLYEDPTDHSFWELSFPHSEMHGGGPSMLRRVRGKEVADRYPHLNGESVR